MIFQVMYLSQLLSVKLDVKNAVDEKIKFGTQKSGRRILRDTRLYSQKVINQVAYIENITPNYHATITAIPMTNRKIDIF